MSVVRPIGALVALAVCASILATGAIGQGNSGQVQGSARVSNEGPVNLRVDIAPDVDPGTPGAQVSPNAEGSTVVTATGRAEDGNGWQDLRRSEFVVLRPDGSTFTGPVAGEPAQEGRGRLREFSATFSVSSADPTGTYTVRMTVWDRHDEPATVDATFDLQATLAIAVDAGTISFGTGALGPGQSTHDSPSPVTVRNAGNVPIDLHVSSNGLTSSSGDATIAPQYLRYSSAADMAGEQALSSEGVTDGAFDLPPGESRAVYFDLHMPTGDEQYVPADTYSGAIFLGGVSG